MRAYVIQQFGDVDQLRLATIPMPEPGPGEIVVRVIAVGLNPIDHAALAGNLGSRIKLPAVLGTDVSGVVHKVGADVNGLAAGDAVLGMINLPGSDGSFNGGGFAEFVAAPATHWVLKPKGLPFEDAAALPAVGLTAKQALETVTRVTPGQRVLIHGAAGGVGHMAVQIAKRHGAFVYATASGDGLSFVKELGADVAIDYRGGRFEDVVSGVSLVLDTVGGEVMRQSLAVLPAGGTLVTTRWPELAAIEADAKAKGVTARAVAVSANAAQLQDLAVQAESGALRVRVDRAFPFEQLPEAMVRLRAGGLRGKLVVRVGGA